MGSLHQAEFASENFCSKEEGLRAHVSGNFYPPHPAEVQKSMIEGFRKYWAGGSTLEELRDACYLRDIEGLYRYFGAFLRENE